VRNNAGGALDGLFSLEDDALRAHKRVAECLEGIRVLLDRAVVRRNGKVYQLSGLQARRGIVHVYGVRIYDGKVGIRDYDLGDLRECKIIKYLKEGDAELPQHGRRPPPDLNWHPNHKDHRP
jgi:hypothetical protein